MSTGREWLNRFDNIVYNNLLDTALCNEQIAAKIQISERHLFRRVKKITGLTPQKYIRQCRLQKAKQYLENGTYRTVRDTGLAVGYSNTSYFIRQFEREFGCKPLLVLQVSGWR